MVNEIEDAFSLSQGTATIQPLGTLTAEFLVADTPVTHAPPHATANASGAKALDRPAIMDRMGNNTELLGELVEMFVIESPKLLSDVRGSIIHGDGKELEQTAHTLKGVIGNFDVGEAYDAALCLERIGKSGNLEEAGKSYQVLEKAIEVLKLQLVCLKEETA